MAYTAENFLLGTITTVKIDTVDIGGTGGQVSVNFNVETEDLTCGQIRTPVTTLEKTKKYQLQFSFAEFDLSQIAYALAQPQANLSGTSYLSITSDAADTVKIEVTFNNDQSSEDHVITFPSCKLASSGGVPLNVDSQGFMDVTFDVFAYSGTKIGWWTKAAEA